MTTRVDVRAPVPNHKRVKVEAFYVSAETGQPVGEPYQTAVLEHGQSLADLGLVFYVHDSSKLVISEVE